MAISRPNAIDLRIDALSTHDLLTKSAAALVDPDRQAAAVRLVHWYLPAWFLSVLLPMVALFYFWRSGSAARSRDALRRRFSNEWVARFWFGVLLGAIVRVSGLPAQLIVYRVERAMSLSDQLLRAWGTQWLLGTLVTMIAIGLVTAVVLALADRTHQWYIYTIASIFAICFACAYAAPYLTAVTLGRHLEPVPAWAQPIIARAEAAAGLHVPAYMLVRERSHLSTAYVIGFGATERVVFGDTDFRVDSPAEFAYVVARQIGFMRDASTIKIGLTDALLIILSVAIAVTIADRVGFRRDDDPVSRLALVGALLGVLYLIAVPVDNAVLQRIAQRADRYALAMPVDRAAAVRRVVRRTDQRLTEVCPDVMARLFIERGEDASMRVNEINGVPPACPP